MTTTMTPLAPIVADIRKKAAALKKRIVLPEGEEKRTLKAAAILQKDGLVVPILLGDPAKAKKVLGWTHRTGFKELVSEMMESDLQVVVKEARRSDD